MPHHNSLLDEDKGCCNSEGCVLVLEDYKCNQISLLLRKFKLDTYDFVFRI